MNDPHARPARINEQLAQYWHELRGDRPLPFEYEINRAALQDVWDACYLISVTPQGFAYDYLGPDVRAAYGEGTADEKITRLLGYAFREVCKGAMPVTSESGFTNANGQKIKYRSSVLPLAARGRSGVAFLLGGMRWKAF